MERTMKQEALEGATSYAIGGAAISMSVLVDIGTIAQALTFAVALVGVSFRAAYDIRKWREK